MAKFIQQMNDYGQKVPLLLVLSAYQCAINLSEGRPPVATPFSTLEEVYPRCSESALAGAATE